MQEKHPIPTAQNESREINAKNPFFEPPVIESFLNSALAVEIWPAEIASDKNFLKQIELHRELNEHLDTILTNLPRPDISLKTATEKGYVTEIQITKLYASLNALLESGQNYERIILYLPFEFLPDQDWKPSGEKLQQTSNHFKEVYLQAWHSLLSTYDVRANFVDGDVMEKENRTGDHPRVVKAAHLVPKLVEKGMLQFEDIISLMEKSDDQILKDSLADTLPVLADMGFLDEKKLDLMKKSNDRLVSNMARIITAEMKAEKKSSKFAAENSSLSTVQEKLSAEFSRIATTDYGDITARRKAWLQQKKKQTAIKASGQNIKLLIDRNNLTPKTAKDFLTENTAAPCRQAITEGIRQAIESVASADLNKARELYAKYEDALLSLWKDDHHETKEALAKTFRRLHQLGIVDDRQLKELSITIPKLAGPFSENLKLIAKETNDIKNIITAIEKDLELSKFIYPVVILYGSRLKGYGTQKSDIDLAIFVKPGTSIDSRQELRKALQKYFTPEKFPGEIVEFWLEEKDGELSVQDFAKPDDLQGNSHWTHALFGGAWEGDKNTIKKLREKLLVPYLRDTGKNIRGRSARERYLEELERDTLQYRLMHKGYEKFFPPYGGIHTPHANEIDEESMFWDSGYRQLATKLFASRVFLPKVLVQEK
jgi:predicted nucleotidyltransferase